MAKQLPFDVFVDRKIKKWEQRAKDFGCDFIDAIGVSPINEMTYFWNGYKRMQPKDLELSLAKLEWSTSDANPLWEKEALDEHAILAVLKAGILRNMAKPGEAREVLEKEVLNHEWVEFKGGLKDNWTAPVAHYEMSVGYWNDYCEKADMADLENTSKWLQKCAAWEAYDLDARYVCSIGSCHGDTLMLILLYRVGMRVKTGLETIRKEEAARKEEHATV